MKEIGVIVQYHITLSKYYNTQYLHHQTKLRYSKWRVLKIKNPTETVALVVNVPKNMIKARVSVEGSHPNCDNTFLN